jgi:thioredoxin reductase (NADPH)
VKAKYLVLATGTSPKMLGLPNEASLLGNGLHLCALCDGGFYREKDVSVVGGGNSALHDALYLSKIARNVTVFHRRDKFRADDALVKEVSRTPNIAVVMNADICSIQRAQSGVLLGYGVNGEGYVFHEFLCDGVFYAIGRTPNNELALRLGVETDEEGFVVTESNETSVKNVFACGDLNASSVFKQAVIAAGDGAHTALEVIERARLEGKAKTIN